MDGQIKIIIADDKPWFREILKTELKLYDIETIAEAENGVELLNHLKVLSPDVILLDLEMPEMNGNVAMDLLRQRHPDKKIFIFSQHNDFELMLDYEKRGAKGYIDKDEVMDDTELFAGIIRKVHRGGKHFNKSVREERVMLTERQKDIVYLNANGVPKKQVAEILGMTEDAVNKQQRNIIDKFGLPNLVAFYNYIVKVGLQFLRKPKKTSGKGKRSGFRRISSTNK